MRSYTTLNNGNIPASVVCHDTEESQSINVEKVDKVLMKFAMRSPSFSVSRDVLIKTLELVKGDVVSFYFDSHDKGILLVSETEDVFSCVMPMNPKSYPMRYPKLSGAETPKD